MKLLQSITESTNLFINCIVAAALVLILVSLTALIAGVILNPSLLTNASFGL